MRKAFIHFLQEVLFRYSNEFENIDESGSSISELTHLPPLRKTDDGPA